LVLLGPFRVSEKRRKERGERKRMNLLSGRGIRSLRLGVLGSLLLKQPPGTSERAKGKKQPLLISFHQLLHRCYLEKKQRGEKRKKSSGGKVGKS